MRTRVRLIAGLSLLLAAASCTSTSSEPPDLTGSPTRSFAVTGGTPSPPSVMVHPQPETCPRHWKYAPVPGSDATMVPGEPLVLVTCSVIHRSVTHGSQLTKLVTLLNALPPVPSKKCAIGGAVMISTQLYFNYASGEVQVLNLDPSCRNVSNGEKKAGFTQAVSDAVVGSS